MDPELERKSLPLQLKANSDIGEFVATFATLGVIDHQGDVTLPGAFEVGKEAVVGAYMHEMYRLPVGKGTIRVDGDRAWIEGAFFLDTLTGQDTYRTVKNAGGLMEWSYIFRALEFEDGEFDTGKGVVPVRYLKKLDVWSVDPVLRGAGIGTGTDAIKSHDGMTFVDQAEHALASVEAVIGRGRALATLRAKEGRTVSGANMERLMRIRSAMADMAAAMDEILAESQPAKTIDLSHAYAQYQRSIAVLGGVTL